MTLPKVLIIGQPFNNNTGGGITLTNLFSGWDKDKIAVACSGYLLHNYVDTKVCNTYYQLGSEEHSMVFPFNLLKHKYFSGLVKFSDQNTHNPSIPRYSLRRKILMDYFWPFMNYIGLFYSISRTELSKNFTNWLNEFSPDIIYAQASSREAVLFCTYVYDYLKKPLIFHMMDDWPALVGTKGLFRKYWHRRIDKEFRILIGKAAFLMSISDYMAHEYKKRYGKDFVTFHNPVKIEFWKNHQRIDYALGDHPTILYAGRTGLGIDSSLETIAKAVQFINYVHKIPIRFIMQVEKAPSWNGKYSCTECKSFIPYNDLPKVFSEVDFLILPYDFTRESIKYIQYSMPTKAPEYMISGTPIIIFAPNETAVVKYAKEYNWAKIVTTNNMNDLAEVILHLIHDKESRREIGANAKRIAEEIHNATKVRSNFKALLCSF